MIWINYINSLVLKQEKCFCNVPGPFNSLCVLLFSAKIKPFLVPYISVDFCVPLRTTFDVDTVL